MDRGGPLVTSASFDGGWGVNTSDTVHPPGFSWVIDGELAGMAHPEGSWTPLAEVLEALSAIGIGGIVSLSERPLEAKTVSEGGFVYLHAPIPDFGVPRLDTIETVNAFVDRSREAERGVVIHCGAGLGRTGTILACYLAHRGSSAQEAIEHVRSLRPGSIETPDQENVVMRFEAQRRSSLN